MNYIAKDEKLKLKYQPGKGAWTYHIQIPGTKHIIGKWGSLKVSGFIDDYKIESKNLFSVKGRDKLLSVNEVIRKAINKSGGDTVNVTLQLLPRNVEMTEQEVLDTFELSAVSATFEKLPIEQKELILRDITSQKNETKQLKLLISYIDKLEQMKS